MSKHPERYILAIVLVIVALGIIGLALTFPSPSDITGISTSDQKGHIAQKVKDDQLKAAQTAWDQTASWEDPANHHQLFISDGYIFYASLYPTGNYIQKDDGNAKTAGGVPINWYRKFGLNFQDPMIDRLDSDGDGFSNKTEYLNEEKDITKVDATKSTSPIDPSSHPSYLSRLRLEKYDRKPFHINFFGHQVLAGQDVFQINLSDVDSSQQPGFLHVGDPLGFDEYIVGPYHEIMANEVDPATGLTRSVNKSTLELDRPDIGFKIVLVYRQEIDSPESTADFVMLMPGYEGKTINVPIAKNLTIPYLTGSQFLVLNAEDTGSDIKDMKTGQVIHVPKLAPGEWDDVPLTTTPPPTDASQPAKIP